MEKEKVDYTLKSSNEAGFDSVPGHFTEQTVTTIINEIRKQIASDNSIEMQTRLRSILNSFYNHPQAKEIFNSRGEIYRSYLKLLLEVELMPWQVEEEQFQRDNENFRLWLKNFNIPDSLQVKLPSNTMAVKDIFTEAACDLILSDIKILSDPYWGYQKIIRELGDRLKESKANLKLQLEKIPDCTWLRNTFPEISDIHTEDLDFVIHAGYSDKFKKFLESLKEMKRETDNKRITLCNLVAGVADLHNRLSLLISYRSFPPPDLLKEILELPLMRVQYHFLCINHAMGAIIDYFSAQKDMSVWLSEKNSRGKVRIEEIRSLFERHQTNLVLFMDSLF